jgi:Bacterial PH domain
VKAVRKSSLPRDTSAPLAQEHEFEAARGLPEMLPPGEQVLWQGSPDWQQLARRAFHVRKLVVYFAALVVLRLVLMAADGAAVGAMAVSALWLVLLAGTALALLSFTAWLAAKSAIYTVTNKRVVMRIGIVLTLTFNIPLRRIAAAGLHLNHDGTGDLPLQLAGDDSIAYLHLWPHARPWRAARPEPMLRCVPQASQVAQLLAEAWSKETGVEVLASEAAVPARTAASNDGAQRQPALAGH